nr:hypothetical protein [Nitrobacter winogradskyi]
MRFGHFHPRRLACVLSRELLHRLPLQFKELIGIVEVAFLVIGKQVGRDRPGVLLHRKDCHGHARTLIEKMVANIGGAVGDVPALQVAQHAALRVRITERQRFGLRKGDRSRRQRFLRFPAQIVQRQPPPDGRVGKTRLRGKIIKACALANERGERRRLIERRQILSLHVLDGRKAQRIVFAELAADFDGDAEILRDVAALLQQLQGAVTPLAADDAKLPAPARPDDKILQEAVLPDAGGKPLDGRGVERTARVALRRQDGLQGDGLNRHGWFSFV